MTRQVEVWIAEQGLLIWVGSMKTKRVVNNNGCVRWYKVSDDGAHTLHREDGPAVFYKDGSECWMIDGVYHRDDGPARIYAISKDGWGYEWRCRGVLHRFSGPAVYDTLSEISERWYIKGRHITSEVEAWIVEQGLPHWQEWGEREKVLFRLWFGGG